MARGFLKAVECLEMEGFIDKHLSSGSATRREELELLSSTNFMGWNKVRKM